MPLFIATFLSDSISATKNPGEGREILWRLHKLRFLIQENPLLPRPQSSFTPFPLTAAAVPGYSGPPWFCASTHEPRPSHLQYRSCSPGEQETGFP